MLYHEQGTVPKTTRVSSKTISFWRRQRPTLEPYFLNPIQRRQNNAFWRTLASFLAETESASSREILTGQRGGRLRGVVPWIVTIRPSQPVSLPDRPAA